jgi:VanZ family protein
MPHDFFAWIARNVLTDEASFERFALFWGCCWFAIVKGWHAFEFAVMCTLARLVFNRRSPSTPRRNIILAAVFSLLFAASDEYHQTFVPERGGTVQDTLIDSLGIGLVTILALRRLSRQRET